MSTCSDKMLLRPGCALLVQHAYLLTCPQICPDTCAVPSTRQHWQSKPACPYLLCVTKQNNAMLLQMRRTFHSPLCLCFAGVLRCLQEVQSLDRFDIESIAPFWAAFSTTLCDPSQASSGCSAQMATHPAASTARVPAVAEQQPVQALSTNMIMGELIRLPEGSAVSCCNMTLLQDALDQAEAGAEGPEDLAASLLQLPQHVGVLTIKAYLLAAMAKDCSIMLSIAPDQGSGTMVESEGAVPPSTTSAMQELQTALQAGMLRGSVQHEQSRAYFSYRLVVIDTDPKPVSKIADHLQLDMNIIAANTNR